MSLSLQILGLPEGETLPRREVVVASCPFVIGRDFECDLRLPDGAATLSRRHLQIDGDPAAGYRVTDMSTNGVVLNGTAMARNTPKAVRDADILEFAGYRLLISVTARPATPSEQAPPPAAPQPAEKPQMPLSELDGGDAVTPGGDEQPGGAFGAEVEDLDAKLLFDPFEDGPGLRDTPRADPRQDDLVSPHEDAAMPPDLRLSITSQDRVIPMGFVTPVARDIAVPLLEREELSDAIDRAVARFLTQFDPEELENEYRDFLGPLARSKRRYWRMFQKQFRRRKDNGEYGRAFRAILAEEVRRK